MSDEMMEPKEAMAKLLTGMGKLGASDLHLKVGFSPTYRVTGQLRKVGMPPFPNSEYIEAMLSDYIPEKRRQNFQTQGDLDFSAATPSGDRFRVNIFRSMGSVNAAIRRVESTIPNFEILHLPQVYPDVMNKSFEGLILVSGVTGSGKSSTMAAMINHMNKVRSMHIITIEDPIEYLFQPEKAIISQREIGIDVPDFPDALKYVVRQDPDCILIGELRDRETMLAAIQAAETGHLVLGSLHCADAQQTFARILEFFPRADHAFIRSSLASSLKAIMCQRLLPGIDEGTLFPATEVLLNNMIVKDKIIREEDEDIPAIIASSETDGMRPFTTSLVELIETEKVHYDTAMEYAPNREALASAVKGIKSSAQGMVGRLRK